MSDTYGPNGEFRRIPRAISEEARRAAIHRFVRRNPKKARLLAAQGKVKTEDLRTFLCALGQLR